MNKNIFDKLSFLSVFLIIVFLPIFFLPSTGISVEISKSILLVGGLTFSVIFWSIARFFDGNIKLPKSSIVVSAFFVILVTFLSALFSKSSQVSFFGTMFDIGSFWFIFSGFLFLFMASLVIKDVRDAKVVLFGTLLSSLVVLVLQGVRVFLPQLLTLGVLGGKTVNLVGSWNSFGIFAGFSCLMSLLIMEFFSTTKLEKLFLAILIIISLFLVAVVNFPLIWILLGISSLIMFTYKVSNAFSITNENREEGASHFPVFAFLITLIALFFFMSGSLIGGWLPERLGISNNEVGPSLSANYYIIKSVIHSHPLWGIGPNRFLEAWSMYKPLSVNGGIFWDVAFSFGSGLIPTLFSTIGLIGLLSWLIFFVIFIFSGIKSIFSSIKHSTNWEVMAFFVLSLYLFVSLFLYVGGVVLFLLALAFTGVFVGLSSSQENSINISFLTDHRKSFFSILSLILLIILGAAMCFTFVERFLSVHYFSKSLSTDSVAVAEDSITKSITLYNNDLYLRTYGKVNLIKINDFIKKNGSNLSDQDKATLQSYLDQSVRGAQSATLYNPDNYVNWVELGSLYITLANFGVKDAYGKSIEAFKKAEILNPNNPGIKLSIAGAYYAMQSYKDAKEYAKTSLSLKPDYIDAYIVLAQISKSEGDTSTAVSYAEQALKISPFSKELSQYVDSLRNSGNSNINPPTTAIPTKSNKK